MQKSVSTTILLVEDEIIIAMTEKKQLEQYGYAVKTVNNGEKAIEAVKTASDIDLILMDINLGDGIDGTQAAENILKNHDIPIVFVSSHSEREVIEKTEKITSYGYVVKNSSITVLDASIKMAFKLFHEKMATQKNVKLLHENEEKYRRLHEYAGIGIGYYSVDGIILSYNNLAAKNMGGVPEDFIGKSIYDLFPKPDADIYFKRIQQAAYSEITDVYEDMVPLPAGNQYFLSTLSKITGIDEQLLGIQIISQDITDQKNIEETLRESEERFQMLFNEAPLGYQSLDIDGRFIEVNQKWLTMLGYERDEVIGKWFGDFLPPAYQDGFRKRFPIFKAQGYIHSEFEMLHKCGEKLFIAFEGKIGHDFNNRFKQTHCILQDITERRKSEEELRESKERFDLAMDASNDGLFDWNLETNSIYYSPRWKNILGYEDDEIANDFSVWETVTEPEDVKRSWELQQKLITGQIDRFVLEFKMKHKHGHWVDLLSKAKAVFDKNGKAIRIVGTHTDITDRKSAEEALRESKQKAELLLNVAAEIIISLDSQGDITLLNESGHRILGYESPELVGKNWFDTCLPEENKDQILSFFNQLMDGKENLLVSHENEVVTKNGDRKTILWHNSLLKDEDGKGIGFFSSGEDITDRKKAEEVLKERTEELKKVQEITHIGSWYFSTETNNVTWTEELYKMYGFDPTKPVPPYTEHMKLFTAESWDVLSVSLAKTAKTGIPYELELVTVRKNGSNGWMWVRGEAVKDEKNNIIGLWGAAQDITEHKKTEEKIKILLSEKELVLKEVHHRIKNSMNTVSSLLTLQAQTVKEPSAIAVLEDARNRIQSMSLLYDKLYRSQDYSELSVKVYLSSLVDEVVANFPNSQMVKIEKDIQDFVLDIKRLQSLGIIINELLTNIMKYAFRESKKGLINVSASNTVGHVTIIVQDDGNGIPESVSFENSTGFGLQLVYTLAQQLGGSIRIERGNGAKVVLEFDV